MKRLASIGILLASLTSNSSNAGEKEELIQLRETVHSLLDTLVEQGVLPDKKAKALIERANRKGKRAARKAAAASAHPDPHPANTSAGETDGDIVRVPYVPEFVKEEIREEVRRELRADVTKDVIAQAKTEHWGIPAALPDWLSRFQLFGDVRMRGEAQFFDKDNSILFPDPMQVNRAGRLFFADRDVFLNSTEDRQRLRARARIGLNIKLTDSLTSGLRLTTGNEQDPISTNQTLGNTGRRFDVQLDHAFVNYTGKNEQGLHWIDLLLGRFRNPWFGTEMVWDEDLSFEGLAATYRYFLESSSLLDPPNPGRQLFFTVGGHPIEEISLSSRDKWLLGAQVGMEWAFLNQSSFKLGVAYYDYAHLEGRRNELGRDDFDFTAPAFMTKGNTLFNIRNSTDPNATLLALASDYDLLNVVGRIDLAHFAPAHITFTGDIVKNFGYDRNDIFERTGQGRALFPFTNVLPGCTGIECIKEETLGYSLELGIGWPGLALPRPIVRGFGQWRVGAAYRHLERDAVLDAFADSNFNLRGTDAEGWILSAHLGLAKNTWLRLRYFSTHEIEDNFTVTDDGRRFVDGPFLGVDQVLLDLHTAFF